MRFERLRAFMASAHQRRMLAAAALPSLWLASIDAQQHEQPQRFMQLHQARATFARQQYKELQHRRPAYRDNPSPSNSLGGMERVSLVRIQSTDRVIRGTRNGA